MKAFKTLDDMGDIRGKAVFVREDLNVPMQDGKVTDDTRLRAAMPTLNELSDKGAKVLVLAHFGRPKGQVNMDYSLEPVVAPLASVLGRDVGFLSRPTPDAIDSLADGSVTVIENSRFAPGEEKMTRIWRRCSPRLCPSMSMMPFPPRTARM